MIELEDYRSYCMQVVRTVDIRLLLRYYFILKALRLVILVGCFLIVVAIVECPLHLLVVSNHQRNDLPFE